MKKILWLIALIVWISFIFYNSLQSGSVSGEASNRITNQVYNIFTKLNINVNILTLHTYIRKIAHFFEYLILGILVYKVLSEFNLYKGSAKILLISFLLCFVVAITDETIQYFVPGRSGQLTDVLIDMLGSGVALLIVKGAKYRYNS